LWNRKYYSTKKKG